MSRKCLIPGCGNVAVEPNDGVPQYFCASHRRPARARACLRALLDDGRNAEQAAMWLRHELGQPGEKWLNRLLGVAYRLRQSRGVMIAAPMGR
jgi:hypothetical protein